MEPSRSRRFPFSFWDREEATLDGSDGLTLLALTVVVELVALIVLSLFLSIMTIT